MFYDEMTYVIKVTDDCFMNCPYCLVSKELSKNEMDVNLVDEILSKTIGFEKINLVFVGGEPLMVGQDWYKHAFEICDRFSAENAIKIEYQMFTNGNLLNDDWWELLDGNNVSVIMSYDGKDKGPKGRKQSQRILEKYGPKFTAVNVVIGSNNHLDIVEIYKELDCAKVKRMMNYVNIYEQDNAHIFADSVLKLFDYLESNDHRTKFLTYDDVKRLVKTNSLQRQANGTLGRVVMNNDFVIKSDGTIKSGLPQVDDPAYVYSNIKDISHIIDVVFSEKNIKHNKDFLNSLRTIDNATNTLTRGGGYFFDKGALGLRGDVPNLNMLKYYDKLINWVKEC